MKKHLVGFVALIKWLWYWIYLVLRVTAASPLHFFAELLRWSVPRTEQTGTVMELHSGGNKADYYNYFTACCNSQAKLYG